nr:hypothetical protein CFP56_22527 [Quercus suber]
MAKQKSSIHAGGLRMSSKQQNLDQTSFFIFSETLLCYKLTELGVWERRKERLLNEAFIQSYVFTFAPGSTDAALLELLPIIQRQKVLLACYQLSKPTFPSSPAEPRRAIHFRGEPTPASEAPHQWPGPRRSVPAPVYLKYPTGSPEPGAFGGGTAFHQSSCRRRWRRVRRSLAIWRRAPRACGLYRRSLCARPGGAYRSGHDARRRAAGGEWPTVGPRSARRRPGGGDGQSRRRNRQTCSRNSAASPREWPHPADVRIERRGFLRWASFPDSSVVQVSGACQVRECGSDVWRASEGRFEGVLYAVYLLYR